MTATGRSTTHLAQASLFDLDGVLVDTAQLHFEAWRRLASELGFTLADEMDASLRGIGREAALQLVLEAGNITLQPEDANTAADRKNAFYKEYLNGLDSSALLNGAAEALRYLHRRGIPIVLASASKNARHVLRATGISPYFAAIVDGNAVSEPKPHPAVFVEAARRAGSAPARCVAFEDADAGAASASAAGCFVVGVGSPAPKGVDCKVVDLSDTSWTAFFEPGAKTR